MTLVDLRCPSCNAPVDPSLATVLTCRFCGATLAQHVHALAESTGSLHETFVLMLARIGPSNRPRVAMLVSQSTRIPLADAITLVAGAPCEIPFGRDDGAAYALKHQIIEAGGSAQVEKRVVIAPILPNRKVSLDAIGPRHLAVIKVVREFTDLGMIEAKELVDAAPCVLVGSLEGGLAKSFHDALVKAGASARIT